MKKTIMILAAALMALSACTKGGIYYSDSLGVQRNYSLSDGGCYMMYLADDLVAQALSDLEIGLELGRVPGTVSWGSPLHGMSIEDGGESGWLLSIKDDITIADCSFPTEFTMVAKQDAGWEEGRHHGNWTVTFSGKREERERYNCKFESLGSISYQQSNPENPGWNHIYGSMSMEVYVGTEAKDLCLLRFNGKPSEAQFVHGL